MTFFFAIQCLAFLGGDAMGQVRLMEMEGDIKASGKIAVGRDFASPEVVGVDVISANGGVRGIATGDGLPSEGEAYGVLGEANLTGSLIGYGVKGEGNYTGVGGIGDVIGVKGVSEDGIGVTGNGRWGIAALGTETAYLGLPDEAMAKTSAVFSIAPVLVSSTDTETYYIEEGQEGCLFVEEILEVSRTAYMANIIATTIETGVLETSDSKNFKIDHPLDPENKFLKHACIESSEMLNVYSGVVSLDVNGESTVILPDWFEATNQDFRYQLTSVGVPAPGLYIQEEVENNQFSIAGGAPNGKVCWEVTGVRSDAYALAHPFVVEVDKRPSDRGHLLNPELLGQSNNVIVESRRKRGAVFHLDTQQIRESQSSPNSSGGRQR